MLDKDLETIWASPHTPAARELIHLAAVVQQIAGQVEDQQRAGRERWLESAWNSKLSKSLCLVQGRKEIRSHNGEPARRHPHR